METEDIFIDDNLFDDTDQKDIKKVFEDVSQNSNLDPNEPLFVDLPEDWLEKVKIAPDQDDVPFIDLPEDVPFVHLSEIQPEKIEKPPKITPNARLEVASNRI